MEECLEACNLEHRCLFGYLYNKFILSPSRSISLSGGGKAVGGYQKSDSAHSFGAGALNIEAQTKVPKVKENLTVGKGEGAGTSNYGAGAVGVESAVKAPKVKHEGLGQVDKTKEQVYEGGLPQ